MLGKLKLRLNSDANANARDNKTGTILKSPQRKAEGTKVVLKLKKSLLKEQGYEEKEIEK